ncbi:hypothetical protein ACWKSR_13295, partial [Campylobacter fetus subsp. venerealis]
MEQNKICRRLIGRYNLLTNTIPKWIKLNNEIMIQKDGKFQFEKDKEAVHSYFVDYINQN